MLNSLSQLANPILSVFVPKSPPLISFAGAPNRSVPSPTSSLSRRLQSETLDLLEWRSVCDQLAPFTSTSMGLTAARTATVPFGGSRADSRRLLDQTAAAAEAIGARPPEISSIEDVSGLMSSAASGELLTVKELCEFRRTIVAARVLYTKLKDLASEQDCSGRYFPLIELLQNCDFQVELEQKIEFCLDCNLSVILDRASDNLEIIRSERKSNMETLESLLKEVSVRIFQAGGMDSPLVTKRRSRMCIGVRASHRHLLPGSVVLGSSSSGATYFVEPKEAVELNNMEVRLSDAERAEEISILSLLTSEIAQAKGAVEYLLDRVLDVDLAFARAGHALWLNGVCPSFTSDDSALVDIEGIQHPLLLGSSLRSLADPLGATIPDSSSGVSEYPIPIDIKIGCGTRVVVISGPNTGGKTASMKTLGLASLMSKAGMFLPAKNHPKLPWFDLVLADIGDQQSLEQNLSTFSGHMSRIRNILEVSSEESLVLIDEIGGGTDPSEGLALSTSILQYLKDRVNLAVVTTHYADLSLLKEKDNQFENAAMEFSLETLRPTYQILWGSSGESNALSIARTIGFDQNIIENAQRWMERLVPEQQQERRGLLYKSLIEERDRLQFQAERAESLHAHVMELYREIQYEAENLDKRIKALMVKETVLAQDEMKSAKSQMENVVQEFENQLRIASPDQFNHLIRKSESAISSISETYCPNFGSSDSESDTESYTPEIGEQVHMKSLNGKLATVVDAPVDDETVLVQYGKIKIRVKKSDIQAIPRRSNRKATTRSTPRLKQQIQGSREFQGKKPAGDITYGPVVQTSRNTVDLRGMRLEEASYYLEMAIASREPGSVIFVIHGMGTGAVKERALEMLSKHPRVTNYEQESSMNYGCTIAYIK